MTRGQRPEKQLKGTDDRPVDPRLSELIRDCWDQTPAARPDFSTIIDRLEDVVGVVSSRSVASGSNSGGSRRSVGLNPARSPSRRKSQGLDAVPEGNLSRPVFPDRLEPEPEPEPEQRHNSALATPLLVQNSRGNTSSRSQHVLSIFLDPAQAEWTAFTGCSLAIWFSLPAAALVIAIAVGKGFQTAKDADDLTLLCLVSASCLVWHQYQASGSC